MLTIPLQVSETHQDIFVVFDDDNLSRIKVYDPAQIDLRKFPAPMQRLLVRCVHIMFANDQETRDLCSTHDIVSLLAKLRNLGRGFQFRPECGDNDAPYQAPNKN